MIHGSEPGRVIPLNGCRALPAPPDPAARAIRDALIDAIADGDQHAAARHLAEAARALPPAAQAMACWAPCIVGLGERESARAGLPGADGLLRSVREQIRAVLHRFPPPARTLWLMPASTRDVTAAHLIALLMVRRGVLARPWIWTFPPREGRFMVVGTLSAGESYRDHPHVLGHATLIGECRRGQGEEVGVAEVAIPSFAG